MKNRSVIIVSLVLSPIVSMVVGLWFGLSYMALNFLFWGLPILILLFAKLRNTKKVLLFSAAFSIPMSLVVDYIVTLDHGWYVPRTIFPLVFEIVPVEDFIFGFLSVFAIISFHEYFFEKNGERLYAKKFPKLIAWIALATLVFIFVFATRKELLLVPYSYLILGTAMLLIPAVVALSKHRRLVPKFLMSGLYFGYLAAIMETTALKLGEWVYDGTHYLGWVSYFGNYKIPFEEFFFFWIVYASGVLAWYELFDDDGK